MGSTRPPDWSFAARAAYFGDQLCSFCDHRNPAGARFCNDCASPLQLKPCKRCDAVNHASATACYRCGANYPAPQKPDPVLAGRASDPETFVKSVAVAATLADSKSAPTTARIGWRSLRVGQLVLAAIVTVLVASAYGVYRIGAVTPDVKGAPSQSNVAREHDAPAATNVAREHDASTATAPAPVAVASAPQPERSAIFEPPLSGVNPEASDRAESYMSAPAPATKPASARGRPGSERPAAAGAAPPVMHGVAVARVGARVSQTERALHPVSLKMMNVSMARCTGSLIARFVCEQRVRQRFCGGHWGEIPACSSGAAIEHRR